MKIIRKFEREIECAGCGALLRYNRQDIKVWKDDSTGLMRLYINCISCKSELRVHIDGIPKLIYDARYKEYEKLLNSFKYTSEFGYIPRSDLEKKEADKKELEKELSASSKSDAIAESENNN